MKDRGDGEIRYEDKVVRPDFSPSGIRDKLRQQFQPAAPTRNPPPSPPPEEPQAAAAAATESAAEDKPDPLPQPGDAYKAHGWAHTKPVPTVWFVLKDSSEEGFAFCDLRRIRLLPGPAGGGTVLVLRFGDTEVRVEGRNFETMRVYLGDHRLRWVREVPPGKDFLPVQQTVVTAITINEMKR